MTERLHQRTLLIGLLSGGFGGLIGLGGGVVMIPLLIAYCGLSRHQSHATSLAAVIATGAMGAAAYAWKGEVDLMATLILASSAMVAARVGALTAPKVDALRLRRIFAGFLIAVSVLLVLKPLLAGGQPTAGHAFELNLVGSLCLALTGAAAGFVAGLLGIGGGSLMVPGMVLLVGMGQHLAQGTSLLAMVPAAAVGTWTHARAGTLVPRVLPGLIPGIVMGTLAGAMCAHHLPESWLRWLFAAFLVWMGARDLRARH